MRGNLRRLGFGLATVTGIAPRGWFIPSRYAARQGRADYSALAPLFQAAEPAFAALLGEMEARAEALEALQGPAPQPRWDQDWFPRLDGAAAYTTIQTRRPARIIEIGSGHSTRFMARAAKDAGLACQIAAIDPAPRAGIAALDVTHIASTLAEADWAVFDQLRAGDLLFIDSSHVAMPGSDVDQLLLGILPRLPAGILLHIHDVLLPDPYPAAWQWRGYNEQLLVGCLLQGGGFELLFASHYVASRMQEAWQEGVIGRLTLSAGAHETSLWLRKRSGP